MSFSQAEVTKLVENQQYRLNKLHLELDRLLIKAKAQAIDSFITQDNWLTKRVNVQIRIELTEQLDETKGIDLESKTNTSNSDLA